MFWRTKNITPENMEFIHEYYMQIINSMPDLMYWIDLEGNLQGCNSNFINIIGLHNVNDVQGSPYEKMQIIAHWKKEGVQSLKLNDMEVLFSGTPRYNNEEQPIETANGDLIYFNATRVPLRDSDKEIIGLVVVLTKTELRQDEKIGVSQTSQINYALTQNDVPKILMIEDNIIAQNVEKALLVALNCQVDIAESADEAAALFHPGKYDLVLMDIGLEDSSGYVVAKKMRQKEKETKYHVPIIALTGFEAEVVKYDCQHYFMEGVISKPLTLEQAEQIIKHYIYHLDVPVRGLKTT